MPLRHSHIAFPASISILAKKMGATVETDEDDLGEFEFFDIEVRHEGSSNGQIIRFASHRQDRFVHMLAEDIQSDKDLAAALLSAGPSAYGNLSVSVDQNGKKLRNEKIILNRVVEIELRSIGEKKVNNIKTFSYGATKGLASTFVGYSIKSPSGSKVGIRSKGAN